MQTGTMQVLITEFMDGAGIGLLEAALAVRYRPELAAQPPGWLRAVREIDGLVVRNRVRVGRDLLAAAPCLRVVGRLGSGLDNLDLPALRRAGVTVVHAPDANTAATAEFALLLTLALARGLQPSWASGDGPDWETRAHHVGQELGGHILGIVGFGRVGRALARRARSLGMRLLVSQPGRRPEDADLREVGAALVELPDLLRGADTVSLHAALTPATHHLIGARQLALLRPEATLVNTARGGLIDEPALATALREGWLAGAALDVRDSEPPRLPDPLDGVPNLLRTPHLAALTRQAQRSVSLQVAEDVVRVLTGQPPLRPATGMP